ncbi:hypothetical protein [Daejeonella sp.]|jgi:hypothetical protein|uniref:hypothetical protein n=1 Tax=Daejeonella sp. TaxID=2805397 RepID=UPI0037BED328
MLKKTKLIVLGLVICLTSFTTKNSQDHINGAWHTQEDYIDQTLLLSDGYFMHTTFDKINKKFIQSRGGTYTFSGDRLIANIEFNTIDQNQIGQTISYSFVIKKEKLNSDLNGKTVAWNLLDQGKGELSGTWRMSGRMQDGKIADYPRRARKTLKLLTGTRFQWAAINAETKEFFGTGGGSYTFENGKYSEKIEYFSRDDSRVGAILSFDGKLVDGKWHHSGQSSTGNPIYEIWSRDNQN